MEIGGVFGLLWLIAVVWAGVSILQSQAGTGTKVIWIVIVLVFPVLGFIAWLLAGPKG